MMARETFKTMMRVILAAMLFGCGVATAEEAKGMLKVSTDKGEATVYLGLE